MLWYMVNLITKVDILIFEDSELCDGQCGFFLGLRMADAMIERLYSHPLDDLSHTEQVKSVEKNQSFTRRLQREDLDQITSIGQRFEADKGTRDESALHPKHSNIRTVSFRCLEFSNEFLTNPRISPRSNEKQYLGFRRQRDADSATM